MLAAVGGTGLASDSVGRANPIAALYTVAGAEVVAGAGETADQATRWANQTLARLNGRDGAPVNLMRPTPDTARLAYMTLAQLGGGSN